jgi:hypothetical protein
VLDLIDPWGDWPEWIANSPIIPEKERPSYLKPEWLASVAPLDPVKWLPELKTPIVRLRDVNSVRVTPETARKKMEQSMPPQVEIVRYEDQEAFKKAVAGGTGFDWIKQQLGKTSGVQVGTTRNAPSKAAVAN